jgi:hypothetical protein
MAAKGPAKTQQTDTADARITVAYRNANGDAVPQIEVSDWINRQKISGIQVLVLCLCGACALLEGLDAQLSDF